MSQLKWVTIKSHLDAPTQAGVYKYLDGKEILYIGKAVNLKARLSSHRQMARLDERESAIVTGANRIKYTLCDTEFSALLLEASLIQQHRPRYNRALKDDKSYLYIALDLRDDYPKPRLTRARDLPQITHPQSKFFGPFPSSRLTEDVLKTIRRLIPFCQQKRVGVRACFYSHLGLCDPCPSTVKVRSERLRYRRQLRQVLRILQGKIGPVVQSLRHQMESASKQQDYELALALRNKLSRFELALSTHSFEDGRVLAGSTAESDLGDLETVLGRQLPRIECYDASTFALHHSVVSLVVATGGRIDKGQYRRFKIKNPRIRSDFAMLEEALSRRLHNRWPRPDLIVVDGGRPQLRRLQPLIDQLADPPLLVGLAKHPDRVILGNEEQSLPIGALRLLERLRDESHRFANKYRKIISNERL